MTDNMESREYQPRRTLFGTLKIASLVFPILIVSINVAGNSSICGLTSLHGPFSIFSPLAVRIPEYAKSPLARGFLAFDFFAMLPPVHAANYSTRQT
jgi:hypothetical protein